MNIGSLKAGIVSFSGAFIASLCCLLPLAVVLLGLGSGAFMMVTMQYRAILLPLGVLAVGGGYYFYFKEKRRCATLGCALAGKKFNLILLGLATIMLIGELALVIFPELLSEVLQRAM